jgi:hypothetical protein
MKSAIILIISFLLVVVNGQSGDQVRNENFPLSFSSPVDCDTIVESHTFEGTCCSLTNVQGGDGGCVLNVMDGNCIVR